MLTWGTGDLLFINDLFPKNWKSLAIGRDDEYLKDPSGAVKASFFHDHTFFGMFERNTHAYAAVGFSF